MFIISSVGAIIGFLLIKKSDSKHNLAVWLPIAVMVLLCFDALIAGIFSFVHIPVNNISMSIVHVLAILVCAIFIRRSSGIQQFTLQRTDIIAAIVCLIAVLVCAYIQFGPSLSLHYATSDPSVHLKHVLGIVNTNAVESMYFAHLPIAMVIEDVSLFLTSTRWYYVFIICDMLFLYLSGMLFYALVKKHVTSTRSFVAILVLSLYYLLAYPLNNMVFGFCYLGVSVSIIALLFFAIDLYQKNTISPILSLTMIMLALLGLILCYALFVPPVYLATFIVLLICFKKQGSLISIRNLVILACVFILPLILGFAYTWMGMLVAAGEPLAVSISNEGFVYRDLYSNFVIIAPLVFYSLHSIYKKRILSFENILFFVMLATIILVLIVGLLGYVSSYYFFKLYYPMWLIAFVLAARGLSEILETSARKLVYCYAAVWFLISSFAVTGIDSKLNKDYQLFNYQEKSWSFLDIYEFNLDFMRSDDSLAADGVYQTEEKLQLYEAAITYSDNEGLIPLIGNWKDVYWYQAVTNQEMSDFYDWRFWVGGAFLKDVSDFEYLTVISGTDMEKGLSEDIEKYEVVYSNPVGYVVKVD